MEKFQWQCPFCSARQIATDENTEIHLRHLYIGQTADGLIGLWHKALRCVNDDCNKATIEISIDRGAWRNGDFRTATELMSMRLMPRSNARPQPEYIPAAIVQDYAEACLIRDDSPKASATLLRRALQGMIRDFCDVHEKTLFHEIAKLEEMLKEDRAPRGVGEETIAAIHAVRKIGNIGAHMEGDINVIVDVDPGEAQALIDLIELLFEEWYVARHRRQERLERILQIDGAKQVARAAPVPQITGSTNPTE